MISDTIRAMPYANRDMPCQRCAATLVRYEDREKWRCKICGGALVGGDQLAVEIGRAHV